MISDELSHTFLDNEPYKPDDDTSSYGVLGEEKTFLIIEFEGRPEEKFDAK